MYVSLKHLYQNFYSKVNLKAKIFEIEYFIAHLLK